MSGLKDPDCPYHVRLHPDERCTCVPSATHAPRQPDVCPLKLLSGEHCSDCDHEWHLTHKSGGFSEPPAHVVAGNVEMAVVDGALTFVPVDVANWRTAYHAAMSVINDLCQGRARWTMSIPARPEEDQDLVLSSALRVLKGAIEQREAELLRLCGPVCEHDQKRAVEHDRYQLGIICGFIDNPQDPVEEWGPECGVLQSDHDNDDHDFQSSSELSPHPSSPVIEGWLKEHSR